jgi:hypothetical protein
MDNFGPFHGRLNWLTREKLRGNNENDYRVGLLSKRFKLPVFMIMIHDMRNSIVQQFASSEDAVCGILAYDTGNSST